MGRAVGSNTQRSLDWCRKQGYRAQVVEKWQAQSWRRIDLFGCVDILAITPRGDTVAIQSCSACDHAKRVTKIRMECAEALVDMKVAGWTVMVQSWGKRGPRGKAKRWTSREEFL